MEGLDGLEVGLEEAEEEDGEAGAADVDVAMVDAPSGVGRAGGVVGSAVTTAARSRGRGASRAAVTTKARAPVRDMKVGVAFDYMRVKVGEIAHLERFRPALSRLLEVPEVEVEGKGGAEGGEQKEKDIGRKKGKKGKRKTE